jgi:hypothetical protein
MKTELLILKERKELEYRCPYAEDHLCFDICCDHFWTHKDHFGGEEEVTGEFTCAVYSRSIKCVEHVEREEEILTPTLEKGELNECRVLER